MKLRIPEPSVVVLIGPSGSGKSTFARTHFRETEVLSSDWARGMVVDDETSLKVNEDAFDVVHYLLSKRLKNMRLCVVDATNVQREARKPLVRIAREHDLFPVAIVLDLPEAVCQARNTERPDRDFGAHVVRNQAQQLRRSLKGLQKEGFKQVYVLRSLEEIEAVEITRTPLFADQRHELGPFDIIGDVHGCFEELYELLEDLGYSVVRDGDPDERPHYGFKLTPPVSADGEPPRRLFFVGDLVDRGPNTPDVLRLVMSSVASGHARCVPGNHDIKLVKALRGRKVKISHGLQDSLDQLADTSEGFRVDVCKFIDGLVSHQIVDDGRLCVAHAGMKQSYQGRASGRVREFAHYGETTGETDEFGLPVRLNWAAEYRGDAAVVYGHTPVVEAQWLNNTICLDTGCVFGGELTALRWPERELVAVSAHETYVEPIRPMARNEDVRTAQQVHDDMLDLADVRGKRVVETGLRGRVTVRPQNAAAALEIISRFAVDPRWLVYLPPTMSPCETSRQPDRLEHPAEAFAYYRDNGVDRIICEEKHMGSRAIVVLARDAQAAAERFGVDDGRTGVIYTRTGRPFFRDDATESALLERVRAAATKSGLWEELDADWMCLDCELMPWSEKAQQLVIDQYAAVGAAARGGLSQTVAALDAAVARGVPAEPLLERMRGRLDDAERFTQSYRNYCWPVESLDDLRLAPFHLMASGDTVHTDRDHLWHMETLGRLCAADEALLFVTQQRVVKLGDETSCAGAITWWEAMTATGGEGMVVKPLDFIARGAKGILQPAVKCRGPEYLRIIYGPSYTEPGNLERLRQRHLGRKRSLALQEFALGVEGLQRFTQRRPLRDVHACAFGVLAFESEPVDPRL